MPVSFIRPVSFNSMEMHGVYSFNWLLCYVKQEEKLIILLFVLTVVWICFFWNVDD